MGKFWTGGDCSQEEETERERETNWPMQAPQSAESHTKLGSARLF